MISPVMVWWPFNSCELDSLSPEQEKIKKKKKKKEDKSGGPQLCLGLLFVRSAEIF